MNRAAWGTVFAVSLVAIACGVWWPRENLQGIHCAFLTITGWPCPFCGMTRAYLAAGHGAWPEALRQSPVGALVFPAVCALALWSGWRMFRPASSTKSPSPRVQRWLWIAALLALAVNWIYRLGAGLK